MCALSQGILFSYDIFSVCSFLDAKKKCICCLGAFYKRYWWTGQMQCVPLCIAMPEWHQWNAVPLEIVSWQYLSALATPTELAGTPKRWVPFRIQGIPQTKWIIYIIHWKPNQSYHDSEKGVQLLSQNRLFNYAVYSGAGVICIWLPLDSPLDSCLIFSV